MVGILTGQPMSTCEQPGLVLSLNPFPSFAMTAQDLHFDPVSLLDMMFLATFSVHPQQHFYMNRGQAIDDPE